MRSFTDLPEWVPGMPEHVVQFSESEALAYLRWLETGEGEPPEGVVVERWQEAHP